MKTSKEQQGEIRRRLINSAIKIIARKGFHEATMKEISDAAGLGSATIYHYFPSKDKIFYAYFEETHLELLRIINAIPGFQEMPLKEKLTLQLTHLLDLYGRNREFIALAQQMVFDSPLKTFSELKSVTEMFIATVEAMLLDAINRSEIPSTPAIKTISRLYWDYVSLVIFYWLKDTSDGCANTTVFIDHTLDILMSVLKSGIITKTVELLGFFMRTHLYGSINSITALLGGAK